MPVCNRENNDLDTDIWEIHRPYFTDWKDFRAWAKQYFNMQRNHWDEGWGWKKREPKFPFCKMLNSAFLLSYGLETPIANGWGTENLTVDHPEGKIWIEPTVILFGEELIILGPQAPHPDPGPPYHKGENMDLLCYSYYPDGTSSSINVTHRVGVQYKIIANKKPVATIYEDLPHVFAANLEHDLLHFWRDTAGDWFAENLTLIAQDQEGYIREAYKISSHHFFSDVVVIQNMDPASANMLSVFGRFWIGHSQLIHYYYYADEWHVQKIMHSEYLWRPTTAISLSDRSIHVFSMGKNDSDTNAGSVHICSRDFITGAWITRFFNCDCDLFGYPIAILSQTDYGVEKFKPKIQDTELIELLKKKIGLGYKASLARVELKVIDELSEQSFEKLTKDVLNIEGIHEVRGNFKASNLFIGFNELAIDETSVYTKVKKLGYNIIIYCPKLYDIHAFAVTKDYNLVHALKPANEDWPLISPGSDKVVIENITQQSGIGSDYRISGSISAVILPDKSIHVFGSKRGPQGGGDLLHYYKDVGSSWSAENISRLPNMGSQYYYLYSRVVRLGFQESLNVFARGSAGRVVQIVKSGSSGWFPFNLTSGSRGKELGHSRPMAILVPDISDSQNPLGNWHIFGITPEWDLIHITNSGRGVSWHSILDYSRWGSGYHHEFRYEPEYSDEYAAMAFDGVGTDRAEMMCPCFESDMDPGVRAGIMLHEAAHIIYWDYPHPHHVDGKKNQWFHHILGIPPKDRLLVSESDKGVNGHKHSMNQIQVEWLADLAEFPAYWVPRDQSDIAEEKANIRINQRFTNTVGWKVGAPRPL